MTDAGSWDTCMLGVMGYTQHAVCIGKARRESLHSQLRPGAEVGAASPLEVCLSVRCPALSLAFMPTWAGGFPPLLGSHVPQAGCWEQVGVQ